MLSQKRYARYLVLLLILLGIAGHNLYIHLKITGWSEQLLIKIFPINGDGSKATERYIQALRQEDIEDVALFINAEAERYHVTDDKVVRIQFAEEIASKPPELSKERTVLSNVYWSIAFRLWANWQLFSGGHRDADIAIFILYFDPSAFSSLGHSVGLQKGMIGLVNAYADQTYQGSNNVIITHEMLHTLGATDKYHVTSNNPLFPIGFAEPGKSPLYPQKKAEIMGGRIPLSPSKAIIPADLEFVVVGEATAREIYWLSE